MKTCRDCGTEKPDNQFRVKKSKKRNPSTDRLCLDCVKTYNQKYHKEHYEENKLVIKVRSKARTFRIKTETLLHYGGKCACCGETELYFLCLDHIEGGGNQERKRIGRNGGWAFYFELQKLGYPKGYQVLCWNCNSAKGMLGYCPHQKQMELTGIVQTATEEAWKQMQVA